MISPEFLKSRSDILRNFAWSTYERIPYNPIINLSDLAIAKVSNLNQIRLVLFSSCLSSISLQSTYG